MAKKRYKLENNKLKSIPRFSESIPDLTGLEELVQLTGIYDSIGSERVLKLIRQELKKRNENNKNINQKN